MKIFATLTCLLLLIHHTPATAFEPIDNPYSHVVGLRLGGSIDFNQAKTILNNQTISQQSLAGSLGIGVFYDFFLVSNVTLSPELQIHLNRHQTSATGSLHWHEIGFGLQFKFSLLSNVYWGVGLGTSYATKPRQGGPIAPYKGSWLPYLVLEFGGTIPLYQRPHHTGMQSLHVDIHLALRGTTNVRLWRDSIDFFIAQNDFSIGIFTGVSIMLSDT
jgi:hypothetical protein